MSVKANKPPTERTLLGVLDVQARRAVDGARQDVAMVVTAHTPRRSGRMAQALAPRVARTATGQALTVRAPRGARHGSGATIAQVVRWVTSGTGLHRQGGGPKRRIRSRRGPLGLPGGRKVWTVAGQKPNPFMGRIHTLATPRVQRAFEQGARHAARAVERQVR